MLNLFNIPVWMHKKSTSNTFEYLCKIIVEMQYTLFVVLYQILHFSRPIGI